MTVRQNGDAVEEAQGRASRIAPTRTLEPRELEQVNTSVQMPPEDSKPGPKTRSASMLGLQPLSPRQGVETLDGYLLTVGETLDLPNLKTRLRTHLIPADVNGIFQESKLAEFLANLVTDYCIPRERRIEAINEQLRTGSLEASNALRQEAIELFVDSSKSGEAGELLLYLLTERVLGAPQIISKMSLKTAHMVHYHGADGVHAKKTERGLALYWGESKIHADRAAAVRECLESVSPFMTDPNRKTASRDLGLIRDNLDVEGKELRDTMVRFFIKKNPEWNLLELRATCLVGFDLAHYPGYISVDDIQDNDTIHTTIASWSTHLTNHISSHKLDNFEIDFFMVPFTDVANFRKLTLSALGLGGGGA